MSGFYPKSNMTCMLWFWIQYNNFSKNKWMETFIVQHGRTYGQGWYSIAPPPFKIRRGHKTSILKQKLWLYFCVWIIRILTISMIVEVMELAVNYPPTTSSLYCLTHNRGSTQAHWWLSSDYTVPCTLVCMDSLLVTNRLVSNQRQIMPLWIKEMLSTISHLSASYRRNGCKQVITEEVHVTNKIVILMSLFLLN